MPPKRPGEPVAADSDPRTLEHSQALPEATAERLLERVEQAGDRMKTGEFARIYKSATDLVALKQRQSQAGMPLPRESGISTLAILLEDGFLLAAKVRSGRQVRR